MDLDTNKWAIYADDDEMSWRCMWDGTGSGDPDRMAMICLRLTESECLAASHGLKDARCDWRARSHYGMRVEEEEMDHIVNDIVDRKGMNEIVENEVESAERVDLEAYDDDKRVNDAISPKLGCIWDGSGCSGGCDEEAMSTRCGRLSHDMTACEGEEGREQRCVWSHGQQYESEQELVAQLIATGTVDVNVLDVVLGVLFVLSMTLVMWRLYRCWMKRGYIKLAEDPHDVEPLMMDRV